MDESSLKGNYLFLEKDPYNKTIYLYPKFQNDELSESNEDAEIKNKIGNMGEECEGEIINIYKNNIIVAIYNNKKEFLKENELVNLRIIKNNSAYECTVKILGMKVDEKTITMVLSIPVIEKQVDRRRFFRLSVTSTVRYCIIPRGEYRTIIDVPKGCFLKTKKTFSLDLSAGGIKVICDENCEVGRYVLLCVYLPSKIDILCKIIRIEPYKNGTKNILCMKYIYIEESDRDKIVEFLIKSEASKRIKEKQKSNY